ncbi:MAG: bifunctional 4-hydroxy-2-oxoglutarate aldolase/2-dehydro-3-deoxy-phosphogluconate aldolase [Verrucomicrobia bacterium]|nr:bifunctional 4-hydroxy-2-oxoglutarate aldolase/2-dehydro-3-deoxy-phosphogluconate aldolase [Verrucomicrobiota bacterium]
MLDRIACKRIVPVVVLDDEEAAEPLAEALLAGGLDVMEITFRTAAAASAIRRIAAGFPEMLLGAGTLLEREQVLRAREAGAVFGLAPGLNPRVVEAATACGLYFAPGVMTPSEVERAMELGCMLLKFFPAEAAGGLGMLQALAGPYRHTGVKFIPTGGVTSGNLGEYLKLPMVAAIGGSWMVDKALVAAGRWDEITRLTREALAAAAGAAGAGYLSSSSSSSSSSASPSAKKASIPSCGTMK